MPQLTLYNAKDNSTIAVIRCKDLKDAYFKIFGAIKSTQKMHDITLSYKGGHNAAKRVFLAEIFLRSHLPSTVVETRIDCIVKYSKSWLTIPPFAQG